MEPLPSEPVRESVPHVRVMHRPRVMIGIVAFAFCAFALTAGFFKYLAAGHDEPARTPEDASKAILGTWREVSSVYRDQTATSSEVMNYSATSTDATYLGFVDVDGLQVERTYGGDFQPQSLNQLGLWKVTDVPGNAQTFGFDTYSYGTTTSGDPINSAQIDFPNRDTMDIRFSSGRSFYSEQIYKRVRSAQEESAADFSRTPAQTKLLCEDILSGSTTASVLLPITCTTSIGPGFENVEFTFEADGSIDVADKGKRIFMLASNSNTGEDATNTVDVLENEGIDGPFLSLNEAFTLQDVTFDGYKDIAVLESAGAYNFTYSYFAFDPKTGTYDTEPILTAINPGFDPTARTITSFDKGRGISDLYESDIYRFQNGAYVLVESDMQDVRDQINYDTSQGYVYTVKKLIGGRMTIVKQIYLTEAQVLGDDNGDQVTGN